MITLLVLGDAFLSALASEIREFAMSARTALLVGFVPTVVVAITLFLLGNAETVTAFVVRLLTRAVV